MSKLIRILRGDGPYVRGLTMEGPFGNINYFLNGNSSAPLIICLHGLNASADQFAPLGNILMRQGFLVLRFDFWGHGLSAPLPELRVKKEIFCDQVNFVMQKLELSNIKHHVIGFSLGGCVAAQYARLPTTKVDKLILLSPGGLMTDVPMRIRLITHRFIGVLVYYVVILLHWIACLFVNRKDMELYYSSNEDTGIMDLEQRFWRQESRRNLTTAFIVARSIPLWNNSRLYYDVARRIQTIMCVFGDADLITPPDSALPVLRKLFPNLVVHVYDNCGHQVLDEASPRPFIDVYAFLVKGIIRDLTQVSLAEGSGGEKKTPKFTRLMSSTPSMASALEAAIAASPFDEASTEASPTQNIGSGCSLDVGAVRRKNGSSLVASTIQDPAPSGVIATDGSLLRSYPPWQTPSRGAECPAIEVFDVFSTIHEGEAFEWCEHSIATYTETQTQSYVQMRIAEIESRSLSPVRRRAVTNTADMKPRVSMSEGKTCASVPLTIEVNQYLRPPRPDTSRLLTFIAARDRNASRLRRANAAVKEPTHHELGSLAFHDFDSVGQQPSLHPAPGTEAIVEPSATPSRGRSLRYNLVREPPPV